MWKWLSRGVWTLVLLIVAGIVAVGVTLRGSLPQLSGRHALPGLTAAVTLDRDAHGVVTIEATSQVDAMRALGYVHAQERYFEMDLLRRTSAGELSALFGARALDVDRAHRRHRLRALVEAHLDQMAGAQRALLEAYTDGVNAGLAAMRVRPWPYLMLRRKPQPWRIEDTALAGYAMYFDLQDSDDERELALWHLREVLPTALYALLTHGGSRWDAPLFGAPLGDASLPDAATVDLRQLPSPDAPQGTREAPQPAVGSNNFAVGGALTADGRAILADDMHLGLRAPDIWFRARLRYADAAAPDGKVDVNGFTLPGVPAVIVGSNGHVAWGFTNGYVDTADLKRVQPCNAGGAPAAGCAPVTVHHERIAVAGGQDVTLDVEDTAWGPIVEHEADGSALALRWVADQPGALNFGLVDLARAGNLDQALATADHIATPVQNLLLADASGRIAWRWVGARAQRGAGCAPEHLVEGADCAPWTITTADPPKLVDPPDSRLWTANARVVDAATVAQSGDGGYALGARAAQIRDDLRAHDRFDEKALLQIQLDDRALFLQRWHELLLSTAQRADTPALKTLAAAATDWTGHAGVDAVSYRLVRAWRLAVLARIEDGLTAPAQVALGARFELPKLPQFEGVAWPLVTQQPLHLLPRRYQSWDALFEDAAKEVGDQLSKLGPLSERTWGERNTAKICQPLAAAIPWFGKRLLCMPADPLPGDSNMPRVAAPAFGASERMVVAPGHEADGIIEMPGGQSGHPLSPYWGAGHEDWVHGRVVPFLPGATRYTLTLTPS
ncbi:penicillin acylase family protein [Solimonas marina]|uniref:Penicillin acylase family protein n=1 Tax=Solimonas marina TaxID=2714601 RepID=A0A970B5L2_9GAMM|nr:penicillin acylase family protein [Solimonas marina]NKF21833.1 penicillin acylase family protein [Solimonas marina]